MTRKEYFESVARDEADAEREARNHPRILEFLEMRKADMDAMTAGEWRTLSFRLLKALCRSSVE